MTWVAPITFSAAATLTAAQLNQNVRDNTNALQDRHQVVVKAADQTINNSGTLTNDTHLKFTAAANQKYVVDINLIVVCSSGTPDLSMGFSFPAGATVSFSTVGLALAAASSEASARMPGATGITSGTTNLTAATPTVTSGVLVRAGVTMGGTGGVVNFMWSQSVATVVDTIVKQNSTLTAIRETI